MQPSDLLGSLILSSNAESGNWFIKSIAILRAGYDYARSHLQTRVESEVSQVVLNSTQEFNAKVKRSI